MSLSQLAQLLKKIRRQLIIVVLIVGLVLVANQSVSSQSITGISAEISGLRSRINRLELEVRNSRSNNLNSAPGVPSELPETGSYSNNGNNPPVVNDQAIGRSDPMFERLATLLVELKEDVRDIKSRLAILEEKSK
jgi:outer membrane murein-binding lipoprotein Lpp